MPHLERAGYLAGGLGRLRLLTASGAAPFFEMPEWVG